jgi:hypothetical protein
MDIDNYKIWEHKGHEIEIVTYADNSNLAIECVDCYVVIGDTDIQPGVCSCECGCEHTYGDNDDIDWVCSDCMVDNIHQNNADLPKFE